MLVTHINVGYEGSAHDTLVRRRSLGEAGMGFPHPPSGKYYVVDSAYPNTLGYLSPHVGRGLRYHLPDFRRGSSPKIIIACFTLHNFIRLYDLGVPFTHQVEAMEPRADHSMYDVDRKNAMDEVRQTITEQIWISVQRNPEVIYDQEEDENVTDYKDNA